MILFQVETQDLKDFLDFLDEINEDNNQDMILFECFYKNDFKPYGNYENILINRLINNLIKSTQKKIIFLKLIKKTYYKAIKSSQYKKKILRNNVNDNRNEIKKFQ